MQNHYNAVYAQNMKCAYCGLLIIRRLLDGFELECARGEENTAGCLGNRFNETALAIQNLHRIKRRSRFAAYDDHILTPSHKRKNP